MGPSGPPWPRSSGPDDTLHTAEPRPGRLRCAAASAHATNPPLSWAPTATNLGTLREHLSASNAPSPPASSPRAWAVPFLGLLSTAAFFHRALFGDKTYLYRDMIRVY